MRRILIALAFGAFALAAAPAAAPAQAAPGTGARVDNTQCFPSSIGSGYTACFTTKGTSNETTTPSGNVRSHFNGTTTFTIKDPTGQVVHQSTHELHYHRLVQDGVVHVEGQHVSDTFPLNGKTCTFQSDFQYANGEVRYGKFQSGCS
jgi:hypothetical protein